MDSCWNILVPIIQTGLTVLFTVIITNKQIKSAKQEKVTDAQRQSYAKCYFEADKLINAPELVYNKDYFETLIYNKAEIKLSASNKVVEKYSDFLAFVYSYYSELLLLLSQDPREQTQTVINEETGDEYEQTTATDADILIFEGRVASLKTEKLPTQKEIQKKVDNLLNAMRDDLNNDKFKR